ncbi:MAG: type I-U CRISPR-associated protein Csb2 [Pirellulaceae bacterium]
MFSIAVSFLTGRVVAANAAKATDVEWPIHPARLFMAMVAGHYEGEPTEIQRRALEWIEALPPPAIRGPVVALRKSETVFVPVNDKLSDPSKRVRQPRQFPSAHVGDSPVRFTWTEEVPDEFCEALDQLAASVVRLGHSSSVVQCWIEKEDSVSDNDTVSEYWRPTCHPLGENRRIRVATAGLLSSLDRSLNITKIEQYAELFLTSRDSASKQERDAAKKELRQEFPNGQPRYQRPTIGTSVVYERIEMGRKDQPATHGVFDPVLIPMVKIEGCAFGLESTLEVCAMLRSAVLKTCGASAPSWITGHDDGGRATTETHIAFVPLPFVGDQPFAGGKSNSQYADGHLLGVGIVLPRKLTDRDKSAGLAEFLADEFGEPQPQTLTFGRKGVWEIQREDRMRPPRALTPETWSRPSSEWATVTPIVLDRHPKTDSRKNLAGWRSEVSQMICRSCEHIGLPQPSEIQIEKHGFLSGVPSSRPGRTGFLLMDHSDGKTRRIQTHALIKFPMAVHGPVILGAGRFRGYGFCKPVDR